MQNKRKSAHCLPFGIHTIAASMNGQLISVTIDVDEKTAERLNQSLYDQKRERNHWIADSFKERSAAGVFPMFEQNEKGVICSFLMIKSPGKGKRLSLAFMTNMKFKNRKRFGKIGTIEKPAKITGLNSECIGAFGENPSFVIEQFEP